jgi:homoserine dehydrogenase
MKEIKIGILGLGTVGSAVAAVLQKNSASIAQKAGIQVKVKYGCDIRKVKAACPVTRDPYVIINDPEISIVVETIGGVNPAKKLVLAAIAAGKHVVTSNKELIALHMDEILAAAEKEQVTVLFEGSVGGGIPILAALRDNLCADQISEIYGIVNGTTNYILSKMTQEGKNFSEVLQQAQKLGFAEANPRMDIEGYDASFKAAILASVAFGSRIKWAQVYREGIEKINQEDILYAGEIGYVIKLLAVLKMTPNGIEVRVHPALVAKSHPLANISENFNAIYVKGDPVGELMFYGPGAGGKPTASAVISDVIKIASSKFKAQSFKLRSYQLKKIDEIESRYYIRLQAPDRCGVLAGISKAFADKKVSIAAVVQKEIVGNISTIVILIHKVKEGNLRAALKVIQKLPVVHKVSNVIRIL